MIYFLTLVLLPVLSFSKVYAANPTKAVLPKMAFVDMQAAILQTEEGKAARAKIEKEASAKRQELMTQQADLKKLDEEFQAQQSILTADVKQTKQKEFQEKFQTFRNAQMQFEQDMRQKEVQETQKIFQKTSLIIQDISQKKLYDLVFEKGSGTLLYASKIDDITQDVVNEYNKKYKSTTSGATATKP